METFYFLSGVCAVIILMMVVGTFVNYRTIGRLRNELDDAFDAIDDLARDLEHDLGRVEESLDSNINMVEKSLTDEVNEIYRTLDSRLDKLTDGVSKQISNIYTECGCLTKESK